MRYNCKFCKEMVPHNCERMSFIEWLNYLKYKTFTDAFDKAEDGYNFKPIDPVKY